MKDRIETLMMEYQRIKKHCEGKCVDKECEFNKRNIHSVEDWLRITFASIEAEAKKDMADTIASYCYRLPNDSELMYDLIFPTPITNKDNLK